MRLMAMNQFDMIYHEHFSYFSLTTVNQVFAKHGLTIFDVEEISTHGGSLRIYARHADDHAKKPVTARLTALSTKETIQGFSALDHYLSFSEKARETKRALLEFLIQPSAKESRLSRMVRRRRPVHCSIIAAYAVILLTT